MRTETCHFWLGKFESKDDYFDFVGEDDAEYYKENDNNEEKFISEFAKSQNENWYDHDFIESGYEENNLSLKEKFKNYSYAYEWGNELETRSAHLDHSEINTLVFITKSEIEKPISVKRSTFYLEYIGEITYKI